MDFTMLVSFLQGCFYELQTSGMFKKMCTISWIIALCNCQAQVAHNLHSLLWLPPLIPQGLLLVWQVKVIISSLKMEDHFVLCTLMEWICYKISTNVYKVKITSVQQTGKWFRQSWKHSFSMADPFHGPRNQWPVQIWEVWNVSTLTELAE